MCASKSCVCHQTASGSLTSLVLPQQLNLLIHVRLNVRNTTCTNHYSERFVTGRQTQGTTRPGDQSGIWCERSFIPPLCNRNHSTSFKNILHCSPSHPKLKPATMAGNDSQVTIVCCCRLRRLALHKICVD